MPGLSADSDEELLVQALNAPEGDLRAFEGLVLRYQKRVVANCRGITRDSNNAEDLAQEVLVKVFYGLRGFERKSSFGRWLQRIKINHCLNHLKKHSGHSFVDVGDPGADEFDELKVMVTAEQLAGTISDRRTISAVLESMPSTLRIPLVLCDMDELSYEEVSRSLGIGLSATKMRIKRAREEFRFRYEKVHSMGAAAEGGRWKVSNGSLDSERNDADDVDPGQPIAELAGFEYDVSVNLLDRIRRTIGRRTTAAQVTSFAFDMPFVVLKEFWLIVMELFNSKKTGKDGGR